ncbi:Alpha/Beta hydrolase protein [Amylocystis lapponica]|nr:Alpha/Beta hydrolase protein [Amylocystis lapponica]
MSTLKTEVLHVGGIAINVFSQPDSTDTTTPVTVLFLLHGRTGRASQLIHTVEKTLGFVQANRKTSQQQAQDLLVITFDHRNHGERMVSEQANSGWRDGPDRKANVRHMLDMYSIHTGSARDISFLIDFLPSYLYPSGERTIAQYAVAGISLGGHSTWFTLQHEPRVKIGIPIIGCPDYLRLMQERAEKTSTKFAPPAVPDSLITLVKRDDPAFAPYTALDISNPFLGKKILVLSGAEDKLVPWHASEGFVENLSVGDGVKKVFLQPGAGHECTPEMVKELSQFLWENALTA